MTNKLNKSISEIWEDEYVISLYQRNYAWQEDQIQQLLQDIYDSYHKDPNSHYFIGSLVVLQRPDNVYEVIDGQQRLTTLHLICKSLGLLNTPHLSYDSRPEVEEFFKGLFSSNTSRDFANECKKRDCRKIFRLVDALDIVETTHIHLGKELDSTTSLSKMDESTKHTFGKYLNNNVIIVRTILPSDTDVAAYFEIMNNRGEQLQEHEIVKALMMEKLEEQHNRSVFSAVWDACSQMKVPIQKGLSIYRRNQDKPLFGNEYDQLYIHYLDEYNEQIGMSSNKSIDEILKEDIKNSYTQEEAKEIDDKYNSIIDFPNFLMHVFKMFSDECPLNSNVLLEEYRKIESKVNPMEFIKVLLKVRVFFDRYIIKSKDDTEDYDNITWIMHKPYKSDNSLRFKNTYSEKEKEDIENKLQKRIIMQESMLQVTFRNKKYKNWLFELLKKFKDSKVNNIAPSSLSVFLDKWIINYYDVLEKNTKTENTQWVFEALGTDTPHFVFNFIDYLYWVAKENNIIDIPSLENVEDFVFKYYNSIEHHLPQSYNNVNVKKEEKRKIVDNIANLCLISRSTNSSLNDKSPTEKAKIELGLSPKRKMMYQITNDHNKWNTEEINEHYKDIKNLIDHRHDIIDTTTD